LENVNYKGFKLTKRIEPVSEQEIDSALEDLRVRTSRLEPVGERGAIEGDIMLLDFQPKGTDKPIRKVFTVSKEGTIVLEGHKPDDAFEAHFEFPENFPDKPLAGKILDADIKIVEVKKLVKPEFNEEFFAQLGDEIKNIETLRARIKEDLEHKHLYEAGQILGREAQDMLVNLNPFELPPSLIEIAANDALKENWDIEKIEDSKKEELLNWLKPRVTRDISAEFILEEIAEIEKVAIGDDELKEHVAAVAKSNNIPPEELYRYWQTENKLDSVRRDLEREKALGIVIKNAEVTE
jgi:trigger factor